MDPIYYIDRKTKQKHQEKIYGYRFVYLLYGQYPLSGILNGALKFLAKLPFVSYLYGKLQDSKYSKKKVVPFIKDFSINTDEMEKKPHQFKSFNDFFYRKLKKGSRSLEGDTKSAIIPADGRYLFVPNLSSNDGFYIKGKRFSLSEFLGDEALANRYQNGVMVIARLCPTDYHRFHFPCSGIAEKPTLINGYLNAVHLISLKNNINVFSENKRMITVLNTEKFGQVVYAEVGAVCVGSILHTFDQEKVFKKGDEKGYFAFGGSSLVLLFEKNRIELAQDLVDNPDFLEVKCKFGQILGKATR
ncbi:MAG: Phosphatidylserine decarboxylase proenzyme [Chlamydiae bacterium]|nr:Phosphatidylserine decarboxylase proenzyme [Chlamydiota bacterium]